MVRIQKDRGHTVAERGPYRFIRHPGYAGMFGVHSCDTVDPGLFLGVRTRCSDGRSNRYCARSLEDHTLHSELDGLYRLREQSATHAATSCLVSTRLSSLFPQRDCGFDARRAASRSRARHDGYEGQQGSRNQVGWTDRLRQLETGHSP